MKCPNCADATLVMTDRQGIEIDYCPQCRGVWLDRGELDKLIERPMTATPSADRNGVARSRPEFEDSDHHRVQGHGSYRRKKSWLSDLFD